LYLVLVLVSVLGVLLCCCVVFICVPYLLFLFVLFFFKQKTAYEIGQ